MDLRSPVSLVCRRPLPARFRPRCTNRCVPSSLGSPEFGWLRLRQHGSAFSSGSRLSVASATFLPSAPALYIVASPILSTYESCWLQSLCFCWPQVQPHPLPRFQSICRLAPASSDLDLGALGSLGLRPGEIHARLADAGSGDTRRCRFPSWRRCHGLHLRPSSSSGETLGPVLRIGWRRRHDVVLLLEGAIFDCSRCPHGWLW